MIHIILLKVDDSKGDTPVGTSNWQHIPFCVEVLMKINPSSVLDVGVGFGRWGILTREFCEVWNGRVFKDLWTIRIEGIEGFARSVTDYHSDFYNHVHIGDAALLIPQLKGPWSATVYGDVLEHFDRSKAEELLHRSLSHSDYVLVNVPIGEEYEQGEAYGNPFERHRSSWIPDDFAKFSLIRHSIFHDFRGRPYGSFVLSHQDPANVRAALFSAHTGISRTAGTETASQELTRRRIEETFFELRYVKSSSTYKLASALRKNPLVQSFKRALRPTRHLLTVSSIVVPESTAIPAELRIAGIHAAPRESAVPYEFVTFKGNWERTSAPQSPYGVEWTTLNGSVQAATGPNPSITLIQGPTAGKVRLEFNGSQTIVDLHRDRRLAVECAYNNGTFELKPCESSADESVNDDSNSLNPLMEVVCLNDAECRYVDSIRNRNVKVLAVYCPKWLGVSSSTRSLFGDCYPVPASSDLGPGSVTAEEILRHAAVLAATQVPTIVFSGGDEAHYKIALELKRLRPETCVHVLWHGGYLQISADYDWRMLQTWIAATRDGHVRSIGTCKSGMEDFFRCIDVPSALVLNHLNGELQNCPEILDLRHQVGLWISGPTMRKPPFAMISAAKMLGNSCLHGAGLGSRGLELVHELKLAHGELHLDPVPSTELMDCIRKTHISMYVTLAECCPMLPLESMQYGVPCLIGPNSHLFEDNRYLFDRLVVPFPERADVIARYMRRAIDERHEIIAEYQRYIPFYNRRAAASVRQWLAMTDSQLRARDPLD